MQSLHGFLDRDGGIESVDLKEIEVRCTETFKTGLDGVEDGRSAQPSLVDVIFTLLEVLRVPDVYHVRFFPDRPETLGQQDQFVTWDVVLLDGGADHLFRDSVRIDVGRVPRVEATIVRPLE